MRSKNRDKDLKGKQFARLYVMEFDKETGHGIDYWKCRCDCGKEKVVSGYSLESGRSKSCGCLRRELTSTRSMTHGHHRGGPSKTYTRWRSMLSRCYNTKDSQYTNYGGRGIVVCTHWKDSFLNFLTDMHECPDGLTLERIDTEGHYTPSNCVWATWEDQQNNRRNNHTIRFDGVTLTLSQWSRITKIDSGTLWWRTSNGWSDCDTLTKPISNTGRGIIR